MLDKPLEAAVRTQAGASIIDLVGEIDSFSEAALDEAFSRAMSSNPQAILLNFSRVDYINSTGIALIVKLLGQARKAKVSLLTYGMSNHYVEIFQITRLADFIEIFPDEVSALAGAA